MRVHTGVAPLPPRLPAHTPSMRCPCMPVAAPTRDAAGRLVGLVVVHRAYAEQAWIRASA